MHVNRSTYDIKQRKDGGEQEKGEEIHYGSRWSFGERDVKSDGRERR